MRRLSTCPFSLLVLTLLALLASRDVSAGTILWYQGKTYTSVRNHPFMDGEYTKSMRVTGWIELAEPLAADCVCYFTSDSDGFLGFSFFDGIQFHRGGDGSDFFTLTTDSVGKIVGWDIFTLFSLGPNAPIGGSEDQLTLSSTRGDHVSEFCDNCSDTDPWGDDVEHGAGTTRVGRWAVVPEPSSLSLLFTGASIIGALLHRRRTASMKRVHAR